MGENKINFSEIEVNYQREIELKNRRVQEKEKEKSELEKKLQKIQEENVAFNSKITVSPP